MPAHWQGRAREVEDRLSDALHERLTQRFVDRRTSALMRSLRDQGEHAAFVDKSGEVAVDGHLVGRIEGLNLTIVEADLDADRRLLAAAARRAALPALRRKVTELVAAEDREFALDAADAICWQGAVVARLRPGGSRPERPGSSYVATTLWMWLRTTGSGERLERWLAAWVARRLAALAAR